MKPFRIVMYYPSWHKDAFNKVRYPLIDQINYAFAIPTEEGALRPLDNPDTARRLEAILVMSLKPPAAIIFISPSSPSDC